MQQAFSFANKPAEATVPASVRVEYDFPKDPGKANGIVLVGEAPGAEETRLGHPFVGRSGQLLDKILEKSGIDRKQCLVANVFRVQPPANKVDHFFISARAAKQQGIGIAEGYGKFGSTFCRAAFAPEIEHLKKTIEGYQEKYGKIVIVALGRTPLWALTGENELLKKVGKPLPCSLASGLLVIPTFHPSFILRGNWAQQDNWQEHLVTASRLTT